jgi:hypothetical protein
VALRAPCVSAFTPRYASLLERLTPWLVTLPAHARLLERCPLGVPVETDALFDPTRRASAPFLIALERLDRLTFGAAGMPMPAWVFYAGAELPGALFGLGMPAAELDEGERARLGVDASYDGLVPLSMYIALPARPPSVWFGHNLASLNRVLPGRALDGLATLTKALGLSAFCCTEQLGATQWDSMALHVHARFGVLELLSAWTPLHSEPWTLTYRLQVSDESLRATLGQDADVGRPAALLWVTRDNEDGLRALQRRIESGERLAIVGRPRTRAGRLEIPVGAL